MDHERFDHLTRAFATATSRRGLLKGFLAAAAGGLLVTPRAAAAARGDRCNGDGDCGECLVCQPLDGRDYGRCQAAAEGMACGGGLCGSCQSGRCLANDNFCNKCEICDRHSFTCESHCPNGQTCCADTNYCVSTKCPDGQHYDSTSCQCECDSGVACANSCCTSGQECCGDGTCKPTGQCCAEGQRCGDTCCTAAEPICCNGNCVALCTNDCNHNPATCACDTPPGGLAYCTQTDSCVDNSCPDGQHFDLSTCLCACDSGTACLVGCCASDQECCPDGTCKPTGQCCPAAQQCTDECCAPSQTCCSDGCCNRACAAGGYCSECQSAGDCQPGQTCCDGDCVYLDADSANCGACGVTCPTGFYCTDSTCECEASLQCGDDCCTGGAQCCGGEFCCGGGDSAFCCQAADGWTCCPHGSICCSNLTRNDQGVCGAPGYACGS